MEGVEQGDEQMDKQKDRQMPIILFWEISIWNASCAREKFIFTW